MKNKVSQSDQLARLLAAALAQYQAGRMDDTRQTCRSVLAIDPANVDALNLQGMAAKAMQDFDDAETLLRQAIRHAGKLPGKAILHTNLANILVAQGRLSEGIELFNETIRLHPEHVDAYSNLGNALRVSGRSAEAEAVLRQAHELNPGRADVLNNLAAALQQQGRLNDAAELYRKVLAIDAKYAVAHYNLGCIYSEAGRLADAVTHLDAALAADPEYLDAMTIRLRLAQMMCDWPPVATHGDKLRQLAKQKSLAIFPFALLALPAGADELQQCARRWVQAQYKGFIRQRADLDALPRRTGKDRIRIGYLSSDYHNHATAYLMAEVFELHDRKRFEIIAYSSGIDDGKAMRRRLVRDFDRFVDIRAMSHADAARLIRDDGIDILVDLKGYTKETRSAILAFRPAPIQINYLGYPGTMGADFVDYILADEFVLPPDQAAFYDEQPAWLPDCYQANDRQRQIAPRPSRAECGLPQDAIVLCCFNHTYKITDANFGIWCKLLQAVPDSILWLLKSNNWAEDNLRQAAVARGIDVTRIVFAPEKPLEEHLARLQNADLFLDTLPYNAHTTASDALWAGVPVVTCADKTFASRVAGSLLRAVGLPELVTDTLDAYFELAKNIASSRPRLAAIRNKLAQNRRTQPLFDTPRFTRHLEQLYERMWQRHLAGEPPCPIRLSNERADTMPSMPQTSELLIGCGGNLTKKLVVGDHKEWGRLTTLDINADHHPDVVWDLTKLPLPFEDNSFDEIHAYEVLEHTGTQGDYRFFFAQFSELWRILKPGGYLIGTCPLPTSVWAWGDPSHTRIVQKEQFVFLDQTQYTRQVGKTALSDFRYLYKADFKTHHVVEGDDLLQFVLQVVKPSRISV